MRSPVSDPGAWWGGNAEEWEMEKTEQTLAPAAQKTLIRLARAALESAVLRQAGPGETALDEARRGHPALAQARGAFVTIYVGGELRGCLGEIEPEDDLAEVVVRCARRVPVSDHRFDPVRPWELGALTFKVSALTPLEPVAALEEIRLGEHGLLVRHDGRVGLLLPEVPVEYGWDLPTFLAHLWRKAGLPSGTPVAAVQLWRFSSQVIASTDFLAAMPGD